MTFCRYVPPRPWLVCVHIWHFAPHSLPPSPLQVQVEAKTTANATVRIGHTMSRFNLFRNTNCDQFRPIVTNSDQCNLSRKTHWEKDVVYLCQFPLCPSGKARVLEYISYKGVHCTIFKSFNPASPPFHSLYKVKNPVRTISPFALKLETWLRLAGIKWETTWYNWILFFTWYNE